MSGEQQHQVLDGRYRIGQLLGEGGMGSVWEALDLRLERRVAVKVVGAGIGTGTMGRDPRLADRFEREAKLLAALSSPYIVTVHDVGEGRFDGQSVLYLVMERLTGRSLDQVLAAELPPLADVARWGEQICRALAVAHASGVVHRDLKPANVMVEPDGLARVLDFGIAAVLAESSDHARLTSTGVVVGTPAYMSPEQIEGGTVEARSDLYSLGCVLYALATGRPPFHGDSLYQLLRQQMEQEAPPPSSLRPELPRAWDELITALLAKRPERRPRNAAETAERLRELSVTTAASAATVGSAAVAATAASAATARLPAGSLTSSGAYQPTRVDPRAVLLASCPQPGGGRLPLATGQRMRLEDVLPGVGNFTVGVDWGVPDGVEMEVDASALVVDGEGQLLSDDHFVFYNNPGRRKHGIRLTDAEPEARFAIELPWLEAQARASRVLFTLSIHEAEARGQDLAMVRRPHIRLLESGGGELLCYGFPIGPARCAGMTLGELARDDDGEGWAFTAVSRGYVGGLAEIVEEHGLEVAAGA
ncbi:protein kinase domain-containing protein [Streptomyces sp. 6N223]|uniref:protein kinase domain-containing protein n=1 Tax=Streptomyces sp. 6N223 TaxID=3457412 RepID=UPI003FD016C9